MAWHDGTATFRWGEANRAATVNGVELTVERRFRGPSTSGNGGYVGGALAGFLTHTADIGVTVTLRNPPPLEVPLDIAHADGGLRLLGGSTLVAEAFPAADAELVAVPPIDLAAARTAAATYPGLTRHPFPECFVCGPLRPPGDGLRLFPGRLGDGRTACIWDVTDDVAGEAQFVWSALDCPSGWAAPIEGRPMVLGRMTAQLSDAPEAGESCVVMGLFLKTEGRKTWTRSTAYGSDGRELGRAEALWITLLPAT